MNEIRSKQIGSFTLVEARDSGLKIDEVRDGVEAIGTRELKKSQGSI